MEEKKENIEELEKTKKIEVKDIKKEENKKSHVLLITILIILLLVAFFGFGYALGGTGIVNKIKKQQDTKETKKEKEETEEKETTKEESVSFTESQLDKYVNYISPISSSGPSSLIYNVDKVEASKLSTKEKMNYVGHAIYEKTTKSSDFRYSIVAEEDVKKVVDEIYGNGTYERTSFNLGCTDYVFHNDDNKYYSETGCGGTSDTIVKNIVIDYKATKNKLEITTAYAFIDSESKIYKNYNKQVVLSENNVDFNKHEEFLENYIKENKDKLNHIVYVFESEDGTNYYFKEFTNNK